VTTFNGSDANDLFGGGADSDVIIGNGGNDTLSGGGGADSINGGDGNDYLYSGDRSPGFTFPNFDDPWTAPVLDTGSEVDTLIGGNGEDHVFAGYGDFVDGADYLYISFLGAPSGVAADFTQLTVTVGGGAITNTQYVSWIQGSNYDDTITSGSDFRGGLFDYTAIFAGAGNDHVVAGLYTGSMFGEAGDDVLDGRNSWYLTNVDGGAGNDLIYTNRYGAPSQTEASAYGGDGNDTIHAAGGAHGGNGDDHIYLDGAFQFVAGDAGNDTIEGAGTMAGGDGADVLIGDGVLVSGNWLLNGQPEDDTGLEHDRLTGGGSRDLLAIGYGDDADGGGDLDTLNLSLAGATHGITVDLSPIANSPAIPFVLGGGTIQNIEILGDVTGTAFDDVFTIGTAPIGPLISGGDGNDKVIGTGSAVSFYGDAGNDTLVAGSFSDAFDGGDGFDTADYSHLASGVVLFLGSSLSLNIEEVIGTGNNDFIAGSAAHEILIGGGGSDQIDGGDGNDHLYGQSANGGPDGADALSGGRGSDYLQGNAGNDTLDGGAGSDRINGGADDDLITAGDGTDSVNGNLGNDTIDGGAGADSLRGGQGNDQLSGGDGDDILLGDHGADKLTGGAGADIFRFAAADSNAQATAIDEIVDFTRGTDKIALPFAPVALLVGTATDQAHAASAGADLMAGHAGFGEVVLLQVGSDTYLVTSGAGATDDADLMIRLDGVTANQIGLSDFI